MLDCWGPEPGTWKLNRKEAVLPSSCLDTFFMTEIWKTMGCPLIGRMTLYFFISTRIVFLM